MKLLVLALTWLLVELWLAPVGYQDATGFHFCR
jgi:hypothetical protein